MSPRLSRKQLRPLRRQMQMIFQDPFSSLNPRMTIAEIIGEPLLVNGVTSDRTNATGAWRNCWSWCNCRSAYLNRFPHAFSGGQRQRIGIARALALNPSLIVADEPVSALDVSVQAQIVNLMLDLQDRLGMAYLFVAHDLSVVKHVSHRVAVMYVGRIVEIAPTASLFDGAAASLHRGAAVGRAGARPATRGRSASCLRATSPTRRTRRPAAISIPAAATRRIGAEQKRRNLWKLRRSTGCAACVRGNCHCPASRRRPDQGAAVTRQMVLPTSSATSRLPRPSSATPTGRPLACPLASRNPVSTSIGSPAGLPSTKGTKITR